MLKKFFAFVLAVNITVLSCFTSYCNEYDKTQRFISLLEEQTQENIIIMQNYETNSQLFLKLKSNKSSSVINGWWSLVLVMDRQQLYNMPRYSFWFKCYDEDWHRFAYIIATKIDIPNFEQIN